MNDIVVSVIATVTAPYGGSITPQELAERISNVSSADACDVYALSFHSDVLPRVQLDFIAAMNVDLVAAAMTARAFSRLAGWDMSLAKLPVEEMLKDRYQLDYLPVGADEIERYAPFLAISQEGRDRLMQSATGDLFEVYLSLETARAMYVPPESRLDGSVTPEKVIANPDRYRPTS